MMGFHLHPLEPGMTRAQRCDDRIYVDFSTIDTSGSLCELRAQVARELAIYLLERCNYAVTEDAIYGVALELTLPETELEQALRQANGDVSLPLEIYKDHVPAEWLIGASFTILSKVVALKRVTS
jgi:hypothetical protein